MARSGFPGRAFLPHPSIEVLWTTLSIWGTNILIYTGENSVYARYSEGTTKLELSKGDASQIIHIPNEDLSDLITNYLQKFTQPAPIDFLSDL